MSKTAFKKILEHPDKDEIISKIILGISARDIHEWLDAKYTTVSDLKFVVSEKSIKSFQEDYLDLIKIIKKDLGHTKQAIALNEEDELLLSVQNNTTYKGKMIQLASQEIDIKKMLANMIVAIETRAMQLFDDIQVDPRNINTRNDRNLREWFDTLGANIDRFSKIVLGAPDQVVQHNVTIQHIDQHVQILQEALRETLAEMDIETSLRFLEIFSEKFAKLKPPTEREQSAEIRIAEAKVINETINKKLNGNGNG